MASENIFESSRPFLLLIKFLGLFPLTLNEKNEFETKPSDVAITFCAITITVSLEVVSITESFTYEIGSQILSKVWIFVGHLAVFVHFWLIFHQLWKRNKLAKLIGEIHNIDLKVKKKSFSNHISQQNFFKNKSIQKM